MTYWVLMMAAAAGAFFHFSLRKGIDGGGRASIFQLVQCFFATILVTAINVNGSNYHQFDFATVNLGIVEGVLYVGMMWALGMAFRKGPSGLTVATMNSAAVIPAIVMAILFGVTFGHGYTLFNGIGSFLVVMGLFISARSNTNLAGNLKIWALCILAAFAVHSIYLSIFQWRALLMRIEAPLEHFNLNISLEGAQWFQSFIFLTAFIIQLAGYLLYDRSKITRRELFWGMMGGIGNALCTFGLVYASEIATSSEKAMIFPICGVVSILLCNLWGQFLYKEKTNWGALGVCLTGLVIGTVNWTEL